MRVATIQEAIEGAPAILHPDGEGGVLCALVTDEGILAVTNKMAEEQGWSEEEAANLYRAVVMVLECLIEDEYAAPWKVPA